MGFFLKLVINLLFGFLIFVAINAVVFLTRCTMVELNTFDDVFLTVIAKN